MVVPSMNFPAVSRRGRRKKYAVKRVAPFPMLCHVSESRYGIPGLALLAVKPRWRRNTGQSQSLSSMATAFSRENIPLLGCSDFVVPGFH